MEGFEIIVLLLIRDIRGRVLLIKKRGHWKLPGGHFEEGDVALQKTAGREAREELGVDLDNEFLYLGSFILPPIDKDKLKRVYFIMEYIFPDTFPPTLSLTPLARKEEITETAWKQVREITSEAGEQFAHYYGRPIFARKRCPKLFEKGMETPEDLLPELMKFS